VLKQGLVLKLREVVALGLRLGLLFSARARVSLWLGLALGFG
jgi:hypothetical protein